MSLGPQDREPASGPKGRDTAGGPEPRAGISAGLAASFESLSRPRRWALAASLVWAVVVVAYAIGFLSVAAGGGQGRATLFLDAMFFLLTLTVPVVLVWLAAWLAEELAAQRALVLGLADAAMPLAVALEEASRRAQVPAGLTPEAIQRAVAAGVAGLRAPDLGRPMDRLIIGQSRIEAALQRLASARQGAPVEAGTSATAPDAPAPAADLRRPPAVPATATVAATVAVDSGAGAGEPAGPSFPELVRALNFPRDAEDAEGFRALKAALRQPALAQLLQAAEDVLNLLSQRGIYVDELPMDPVDAAAWRRFIRGVRGPEVAAVGGLRDPGALDTARRLMAEDSIFRDSALFFQRRFDHVLSTFAAVASDPELIELAGTRSARAFMLLARLNRTFE